MWLYYDTEATGLCHPFDQAIQIAAIITSKKWREYDSLNLKCRLRSDIIPSPEAMLITRQKPADLDNNSLPSHYDMMTSYHRFLNERILSQKDQGGDINGYVMERPITFKGHNIISFDENVTRHNSHVTLHNPYIYMMDNCARFDTLICAQAIMVYGTGAFKIPETEKGNPSFRLGRLCSLNDIKVDTSALHDALVDVRYTVRLDQKMQECEPEIYYQMDLMATKQDVRSFVEKNKCFSFTMFHYGKPKTGTFTAVPNLEDGRTRTDSHQIVWDMTVDPEDYFDKSLEELSEIFAKSKKGNSFKMGSAPFFWIKRSDQPIMMPMNLVKDELKPKDKATRELISQEELEARADKLKNNPDFVKRLNEAFKLATNSIDFERSQYAQEWLYEGFPDKQMKEWMTRFHRSTWPERMTLLEGFTQRFDKQLKENDSYKRYLYFGYDLVLQNAPRHLIEASPFWRLVEFRIAEKRAAGHLTTTKYVPRGLEDEAYKCTLPLAKLKMETIRDAIVNPVSADAEDALKEKYSYNDKREILPLVDAWLRWYERRIVEAKQILSLSAANDNPGASRLSERTRQKILPGFRRN